MRKPASLKQAEIVAIAHGVHSLTTGALQNPKVAKNADVAGVLTLPLHLAPADSSGVLNTCPFAGACKALCLDSSGNPAYAAGKQRARVNRTRLFVADRAAFFVLYAAELVAHVAAARDGNMEPAARPNATSDLLWERFPVTIPADLAEWARARHGVELTAGEHANIMAAFPMVQFYDYTKIPPRHRAGRLPENYKLTYSFDPANNPADIRDAIARGWNVAVPFQTTRGTLPAAYELAGHVLPVLDGDEHDYRPADVPGHIVGLRFKRISTPAVVARIGAHAARTGAGFALPILSTVAVAPAA